MFLPSATPGLSIMATVRLLGTLLAAASVSIACNRPGPLTVPAGNSQAGSAGPAVGPPVGRAQRAAPDFVNRVWKVARGSEGDPGTFYVFLDDGSLLIASPHGRPSLGSWHSSGDVLTMVEQGMPRQASVQRSTPDTFAIRIAGPGQPVQLTFVPGGAR